MGDCPGCLATSVRDVLKQHTAPATNEKPSTEALFREIGEGLCGVSGADFYTDFYTPGWDAPGRTGPRRHTAVGPLGRVRRLRRCWTPAAGRLERSILDLRGVVRIPNNHGLFRALLVGRARRRSSIAIRLRDFRLARFLERL